MNSKVDRMAYGLALLLAARWCPAAGLPAGTNRVSLTPEPDWVRRCDWAVPARPGGNEKSEGTRLLLHERQVHPGREEDFTRVVRLMENETGVQDSGSLTIDYDPSYQELLLHRIEIHRAGEVLNRLDVSKLKIIQSEPGLGDHVFTGEQTAVLFVEDLRVGDALEYAFTLRGANPVLGGRYAARFLVQSATPVDRRRIRVVWPSNRPLHRRQHQMGVAPRHAVFEGGTEDIWDFTNLTAIPVEDDLPDSCEPYPYVELSEFDDWARVVEWALPLFASASTNMPPELRELIARWQRAPAKEERVRLALQFVQDELRYTGIELGPDSYRPAPPFETFRLRYGDCKGKALLLCTILRELDVEAYPAMVNTYVAEAVSQRLASPFAFDHVIVKLVLDGATVWVDPTISHQGGRLWDRHVAPLGKALVIKPGVTVLEEIPTAAGRPLQHIISTFELGDYDAPAALTVLTRYQGSAADRMREYLARNDAEKLRKDYLNFYASYYPGIGEARPLEVADNRTQNVLNVTERYRIKDLWEQEKSSRRWQAEFHADAMEKVLTAPDVRLRKMPLRVPFPLRREQELVVHLPKGEWNINDLDEEVEHDAFRFRYRRKFSGSTVRFEYECETRQSAVPAGEVAGYLKKLDEMQDLLGDTLFRPTRGSGAVLARLNWQMVAIGGFGLISTLIGSAWLWYVTRPRPAAAGAVPPLLGDIRLEGLSGWLILVGIGLCLGPLWRVAVIARNWEGFFSIHAWQAAAVPSGELYHPLYGLLLIFEVLGNAMVLGLNIFLICLFFGKRRVFPRFYVGFLALNAAFLLADEVLGNRIPSIAADSDPSSARDLRNAIIYAVIWSLYVLRSKRVKATFVR